MRNLIRLLVTLGLSASVGAFAEEGAARKRLLRDTQLSEGPVVFVSGDKDVCPDEAFVKVTGDDDLNSGAVVLGNTLVIQGYNGQGSKITWKEGRGGNECAWESLVTFKKGKLHGERSVKCKNGLNEKFVGDIETNPMPGKNQIRVHYQNDNKDEPVDYTCLYSYDKPVN